MTAGGALLPSSGRILLAPLSVPDWWEARVGAFDGWADVYGFNMGAYEELVVDSFATKPLLEAWTGSCSSAMRCDGDGDGLISCDDDDVM